MASDATESGWEDEARALAASAAALVRELAEEGVVDFERLALPASAPALEPRSGSASAPAVRSTSRPAVPEKPSRIQLLSPQPVTIPTDRTERKGPVGGSAPARVASGNAALDAVRAELGDCRRCGLCDGRNTIVFGDGNPDADLLFVGEGPGEQEDRTGLPFVGRAGELLTQMIEKGLGIPRSEVYICNIVKCRPPQNRTPLPPEVKACRPFLDGQIEAVAPKVIVALGKPATSLLLDREISITRVRGTWQQYRGIPLMPTFHPAYVLRQYTPENRRAVWQDLRAALERSRA
jgi:uracil-DNA glycosylase